MDKPLTDCRFFTGYKPCSFSVTCSERCLHQSIPQIRILLIHLGALGAVLRSTSLLKSIHQKYPKAHLTWVTDAPAEQLLLGNPLIDRVLTTSSKDQLILNALCFDIAFVVDKSLQAVGLLRQTRADQVFGFVANEVSGAILPATPAAEELWSLGLSDEKKFRVNKKSEVQLLHEALELGNGLLSDYYAPLTAKETVLSVERKKKWKKSSAPIIGINTGCASTLPSKKWTVSFHREVIQMLLQSGYENIVLLGGKEDQLRNQQIAYCLPIIQSDTNSGLRDGLTSVAACDLVITGDSLGMHMAISQKKFVIAWFGPSCIQEIELFGRGIKLQSAAPCSPCWKKSCDKNPMCYDLVGREQVGIAVKQGELWYQAQQTLKPQAMGQEQIDHVQIDQVQMEQAVQVL